MNPRFFILLLFACIDFLHAQNCADLSEIISLVNERHFNPPVFDEMQAEKSIDAIFNELDPYHLIFLESDIIAAKLKAPNFFEKDAFCSFSDELTINFTQRIATAQQTCLAFKKDWLNAYAQDQFVFSEKNPFASTAQEKEENWKKWSVYKYNSIRFRFSEGKEEKSAIELEQMHLDNLDCFFSFFTSKDEVALKKLVVSSCFNAILSSCDPHSNYFTNDMFTAFDMDLSKDIESFGLSVYTNKLNELLIAKVAFNSPAFYAKEIKKDDKLLAIIWTDNTKDELICAKAFEINRRLLQKEETKITLILKNTLNEIVEIPLEKSNISNEENSVNGYILNGPKKVAYIALPGFYQNGSSSSYGCANDIAKELTLLKKEGVEGLIFDLRGNGGGSIQEAIELSGIFINEGPLLIDSSSFYDDLIVLKDVNRGMIYSGPMLVMVNGSSASASEMFASVMKDYNRALIVGSTTYGKASGQSMEDVGKDGTVKITELQLCNLKGHSFQKKGLEPDISLPIVGIEIDKEKDNLYALEPINVIKKTYYKPLKDFPIATLLEKSQARTGLSEDFKLLNDRLEVFNKMIKQRDNVSLDYPVFASQYKEYEALRKELKDMKFEHTFFTVELHNYMKEMLHLNLNQKSSIDFEKEAIFHDLQIQESYNILLDLINLR